MSKERVGGGVRKEGLGGVTRGRGGDWLFLKGRHWKGGGEFSCSRGQVTRDVFSCLCFCFVFLYFICILFWLHFFMCYR